MFFKIGNVIGLLPVVAGVRIPRSSRAVFRFDRAQHSDVISRSIPI
jgi:hypothetical protein